MSDEESPRARKRMWKVASGTFMVPSFKNTASIFPEISFIQYFPHFSCKQYDVITDLICIIENVDISKTKKDISERKTPFFCILKGLSNKHKLFFTS